jgi:phosphoenolpyruvate carboxykinase (ATP)
VDENFGFEVPVSVPGVESKILDPRQTWADGQEYDETAAKLVGLFADNFKQFEEHVDNAVLQIALKTPEPAL